MAAEQRQERLKRMTARGWGCLVLLLLPPLAFVLVGWYMTLPRQIDLVGLAEISRLPLPDNATLLQSSVLRFPFDSAYAHLRMSDVQFERFQSEIDFDFARDPEMVGAAHNAMVWHHGETPDWWRPGDISDPLAAWASRPAMPPDADWSRWVAILAGQRPDGSLEMYLFATQDP